MEPSYSFSYSFRIVFKHPPHPLLGACYKYTARSHKAATTAEQTTLTMDRLPQLSVKATKVKASGVQTVLYMWCPRTTLES